MRESEQGLQIAVLRRRRYRDRDGSPGDWVLPKGHLDPGESPEQAALREVEEETGCRARIEGPPVEIRYPIGGAEKRVHFFPMRCESEGPVGDLHEVQERIWLAPARACERLSYDSERDVVRRLCPGATGA